MALLVIFPAYYLKLRFARKEKLYLAERLGFRLPERTDDRPLVWIHAVSVGEVLSLQSLIREIKARHPRWIVFVSALTGTGYRMAKEKISGADRVFFIPLDFGLCVRKVLNRLRPRLLVLTESEFWPRLLHEAGRRSVPVLLVNGRISARSGRRMRRGRFLFRRVLAPVRRFLVQTELDRERLLGAGIGDGRIAVAGNLKCEVRLPVLSAEDMARLKDEIGAGRAARIIVGGSLHPGEEGPLLRAFAAAKASGNGIKFILAPRHCEKFADLENAFAASGLVFARRTAGRPSQDWDVLILDTMGELARFYALADAAFIGGSLISWGGQNLLEPAFFGKPVFFGPHMDNFASLAEAFVQEGGARIVRTHEDLRAMFEMQDDAALTEMGRRARLTLESLSGATDRTIMAMEEAMEGEERHKKEGQASV